MGFEKSFQYVKQPKILRSGKYTVKLGLPYDTEIAGHKVLRFPFTVVGEIEECRPNHFDLFYLDDFFDKFEFKMFCTRLYSIVECFRLSGELSKKYYSRWVGKTGEVRIKASEKGFMKVSWFYKKDLESRPAFYYGGYRPVWFI